MSTLTACKAEVSRTERTLREDTKRVSCKKSGYCYDSRYKDGKRVRDYHYSTSCPGKKEVRVKIVEVNAKYDDGTSRVWEEDRKLRDLSSCR